MNKLMLLDYIVSQLNHFFPDGNDVKDAVNKNMDEALDRTLFSIKHIKLNGYTNFDYLHSDLYAQFVYYLSNTIWQNDANKQVASKLFALNKALHGLNCMYDTKLPDIFLLIHCVGAVLGKATYANYFVACQNITIGSDKDQMPVMKGPVYMGPASCIIGSSEVNAFTHLSIGACLLNKDTPVNSLVVGSGTNLEIKKFKKNLLTEVYFHCNPSSFSPDIVAYLQ